jgi:hypothetical protein
VKRKVFDQVASIGGAIAVVALVIAGALLLVGANWGNNYVHNQLADQQIYFPPASAFAHPVPGTEITPSMIPSVSQYAGQQLLTGQQAEVYANDFIAVHLNNIGHGKTYAQLSEAAMALPKGSPAYTAAEQTVQTVFQGTTLRGLLLEAYGFSLLAAIAFWCGIAALCLAAILAVLVILGFLHARRTSEAEELVLHTQHGDVKAA